MFPSGFDPSKVDPKVMAQMQALIQRLPRGQLAQLQQIMQKSMSGKDVTQEAMALQRTLPPEFLQLAMQMQMSMGGAEGMPSMPGMPGADAELSEEEAKRIVAEAAKDGKLSGDKATELLGESPESVLEKQGGGVKKFFKNMIGKN
jgi:hypothetical protein